MTNCYPSPAITREAAKHLATNWAIKTGHKIKHRRETLNLSREQLAVLCDTTVPTITRIESGDRKAGPGMALAIAFSLAVEPAELFGWPTREEIAEAAA